MHTHQDNPGKLIAIADRLDNLSLWAGRTVAWLTLIMVLVTFTIVVLRYGFNLGWIALQESVTYMHALVFLLGIPYTLKKEGHVRVDIFYNKLSPRSQQWIDMLGALILMLPMSAFIAWMSWDYVIASWEMREESGEAGGLPGNYLLRTTILVMAFLLLIQGLSLFIRNLSMLLQTSEATS